jgi:predicted GH43/DUF377 family glycosyl hydrolase
LVRGEDAVGRFAGTSRIGLAWSDDGEHFELEPEPVLGPSDDEWSAYEAEGGCEDPRVVAHPDGGYVCTYTGFAGRRPILMVATSDDLRTWTKHGPALAAPYGERALKSGAIVTQVVDDRLVAARVNGSYWMYFGEGTAFAATSDDLVHWTPVDYDATGDRELSMTDGRWSIEWTPGERAMRPLVAPRAGRFDARLVEPGPPAVRTDDGIVLLYNGADDRRVYEPGQVLFDPSDPTAVIARSTEPFMRIETEDEQTGQVDNVCFAEGLVYFEGQWRLYFGMADSKIGCAVAP